MQAEEAVLDVPVFQKRFPDLEEFGDPGVADVGIERLKHIIDHPEDGLATLGLTEVIALGCAVHLFDGQFAGSNERLKEVEVISATGFYHRHRGEDEVHLMPDVISLRSEGLEGVREKFVPSHNHGCASGNPYIYT